MIDWLIDWLMDWLMANNIWLICDKWIPRKREIEREVNNNEFDVEWWWNWWHCDLTFFIYTACEWITSKARHAWTDGIVINHATESIIATCTGTRIFAAFINTRSILWAVRTTHAFRSAIGWSTYITGQARAHRMAILFPAVAIQATGWRFTWIAGYNNII